MNLSCWEGTECPVPALAGAGKTTGYSAVLGRPYFTRQAATLLKFAKSTSNPELAATLIERAANLKAQIDQDERPDPTPLAPDVEPEK